MSRPLRRTSQMTQARAAQDESREYLTPQSARRLTDHTRDTRCHQHTNCRRAPREPIPCSVLSDLRPPRLRASPVSSQGTTRQRCHAYHKSPTHSSHAAQRSMSATGCSPCTTYTRHSPYHHNYTPLSSPRGTYTPTALRSADQNRVSRVRARVRESSLNQPMLTGDSLSPSGHHECLNT